MLEINHISKSYKAHQALNDISLFVPKKSIYGLLGPNGAGKTTLIRIITKIIEPDQGSVRLLKGDLSKPLARQIGYLPEERGLYKKMKVLEQIVYLLTLKGLLRKEAEQKAIHWLDRLQLMDWKEHKIEDLSKGMSQKIQFIATVGHSPLLVILDEPFSGFDPINADLIKQEILEMRDKGTTFLFSTHRMDSVEELCDQFALINNAKKILDGSKQSIKETYRDNLFVIEYMGELGQHKSFDLIATEEVGAYRTSTIRYKEKQGTNALLKVLMSMIKIKSFKEKIPSINEVFISKVQSSDA